MQVLGSVTLGKQGVCVGTPTRPEGEKDKNSSETHKKDAQEIFKDVTDVPTVEQIKEFLHGVRMVVFTLGNNSLIFQFQKLLNHSVI